MSAIKNKYKPKELIKEKHGKKIEKVSSANESQTFIAKSYPIEDAKSIQNELWVYETIKEPHLHGFCEIKEGFKDKDRFYIIFEEMGRNLEQLRILCGGRFSLKTTLMIGLQMIERIEFIHQNGFIHGDIKPSNFLLGRGGKIKHKIYLVDFELSHPFLVKGKHIPENQVENFSGSLRFCGIGPNSYKNICRRDEVISWLYCVIFFMKGELPWMAVKANSIIEAYNMIATLKCEKKGELLSGLPDTFVNIYNNILGLKFEEKPNYTYYKQEMVKLMKKNGYEIDYGYDWELI